MSVKFGTDGWRAIIAKDFTFDNLNLVTQATARWIIDEEVSSNGVVIGHDARFMGREFTEYVATIFAAMGVPVRFADTMATTPSISWAALKYDAVGIVITASHNPPNYNGFKIKAPFGGPASQDQIDAVEQRYEFFDRNLEVKSYGEYLKAGVIREIPLTEMYLDLIREKIDLKAIQNSGINIAHDPMYGVGQGLVKELLGDCVKEINASYNPSFMGRAPEPIVKNLQGLAEFTRSENCAIGIANDGDADRVGLFDENGNFVDSHQVLSLLAKYLHQDKGFGGTIVKTFSTTSMLNKQAEAYHLPLETTKIGFKYIAEKFVTEDVLLGGEESGGLAVKGHIPERDGIYIALVIVEMMVKSGKKLSELVQSLFDEFGPHYNYRGDVHTTEEKKVAMIKRCADKSITTINGKKVVDWEFMDGTKHWLEDGSWLLVRASGTEPVLRIYSEDVSPEAAQANVDDVIKLV